MNKLLGARSWRVLTYSSDLFLRLLVKRDRVPMTMSHKGQVVLQFLVPISVGYLVLAYFLLRGLLPSADAMWQNASGITILSLAAMLVQDLIPKELKEFLIFFRKRDRLPSHRAFSEKTLADPRIDIARIHHLDERKALTPAHQSNDWYREYSRVSEQPSVNHYSFRYLGWRDAATLSIILSILSLPVSYTIGMPDGVRVGIGLTATGLAFYGLCVLAARHSSSELVTAVLVRIADEGDDS